METAALFLAGTSDNALLAALSARGLLDGAIEHARGFVYFRLPPPEQVPFRDAIAQVSGDLEPAPGELWVTHPFECWLVPDARAPEGRHRPHAVLPVQMLASADEPGEPIAAAAGVEVRTLPANAPYLLLALEHAGLARPLLRILD